MVAQDATYLFHSYAHHAQNCDGEYLHDNGQLTEEVFCCLG